MSIQERKKDHVDLCVYDDVGYEMPTGFDRYYFRHNAMPEINIDDVSVEGTLLGRSFSFPLMISSMTGGYSDAGRINAQIARFCESENLPFGVGSQRALLDHPEELESFSVVRDEAPTAFIAANIGGAQIAGGLPEEKLLVLIDSIKADAIIVHLNPLQELVQPEGDRKFAGIENGIARLVTQSPVPVIVKETGAGISGDVARRLLAIGVSVIDVAGAGGTSWSKVENKRKEDSGSTDLFNEWGIPTLTCVKEAADLHGEFRFELIASGGIRGASDIVKAHCFGADFTASARPVIQALIKGGEEELQRLVDRWKEQTAIILTLLGRRSLLECSTKDVGNK
ncbi:type 2 isopentenyl-diphosphate Delta-isomerase [Rhodohalobacter sp. 8-1]|uniref:type 2 isopentenyl-diphosphate Delta-isomerase n=1 Tax=Rhodohalobacter sp. 8-1 TaxID=3131972 RepID=UPI0030EF6A1A